MDELLNKKILIVDDETELLRMIEDILFSEGFFNICTAENCKKAITIAKAQTISLFVLDVNLPDGNGFMLYNELRKVSNAPVIFLTKSLNVSALEKLFVCKRILSYPSNFAASLFMSLNL